jgi:hypothetical protein
MIKSIETLFYGSQNYERALPAVQIALYTGNIFFFKPVFINCKNVTWVYYYYYYCCAGGTL